MLEDFRLKVFMAVRSEHSFTKAARSLGISQPAVSQNIAELEKEIKEVVSTDPYQFKYILEDPEAIKLKKEELTEELKEYEEYAESLKEIYNNLFESGVVFTWQMN